MKIKVWGCRGSIATPRASTLRYGGNTTCIEVRTAAGAVLIVDAGSGVRNLGKSLCQEKSITQIRFFFTHSHWDHLVGFPFFQPAYSSNYSIVFCGGRHAQASIKRYLSRQMEAPYFPVDFSLLKARFNFECDNPHCEPRNCHFEGMEVSNVLINHPNGGFGYKFTEAGKTFVFMPDNELGFHHEGGPDRAEHVEFCRGADLLLHDAQYTEADYEHTRGWGHSTFANTTDLAVEAGVKRLGLFHHDPDRTDDDLDRQAGICQERIREVHSSVECFAAAEGMTFEL